VLTRELVPPPLKTVTVAPITTTIRGLSTEVPLGSEKGFKERCVAACRSHHDRSRRRARLTRRRVLDHQEITLTHAIRAAFDLD
jgi:mRNA interferase MazF